MEPPIVIVEDLGSGRSANNSSTVPPNGISFSHLKRAFLSDLTQTIDQIVIPDESFVASQILNDETPHPAIPRPVDTAPNGDDDDDDGSAVSIPDDRTVFYTKTSTPSAPIIPFRHIFQRYSAMVATALGTALLTGFSRRALGSILRCICTGLLMTQTLSLLGYAEVHWKKLMTDIWAMCWWKPHGRDRCSSLGVIGSSTERKVALVCGFFGGLLIL